MIMEFFFGGGNGQRQASNSRAEQHGVRPWWLRSRPQADRVLRVF